MKMRGRHPARLILIGCIALVPTATEAEEVRRREHVVVSYEGIGEPYADAIARTAGAARAIAAEKYGFAMPEGLSIAVDVAPTGRARLFNDGQDHFSLTVRSEADLRRPSESGIFHLYGLCHEVGHLAMYRLIRERGWMTTAAAEGWAHYLGSRLVDDVFDREGPDLWPDRYRYRDDGMARLDRQLAAGGEVSDVTRGAGLWRDLVAIVGDRGVAPIFAAWGRASVDPADPSRALGRALSSSPHAPRLRRWWAEAEAVLVRKRSPSAFAPRTARAGTLAGAPRELARDDGQPAGKRSIAGGGHAVKFDAPGDGWYLTAVRVHGARYGPPEPPPDDRLTVSLCDERFRRVAAFSFPYSRFERGRARWVELAVPPTEVPRTFVVCVGFDPTARKGVFVDHDAAGCGASLTGLPGGEPEPFGRGDWMIRARVDGPPGPDALRPAAPPADAGPSPRPFPTAEGENMLPSPLWGEGLG
jgi:hypothetical protein